MKKSQNILYFILLIPVIFFALLFFGAAVGLGNYQVLTVLSGSMEPNIKTGSTIVISPVENYQVGDIITFRTLGAIPTTHRIEDVRIEEGNPIYITKGDANPSTDLMDVKKSDIAGKVFFSIPYLGHIVEFIKTPFGFIIIIGLPAVIVIYEEIKKIWVEIKKIKDKNNNKTNG